jgi:hypothetical protein
MLCKKREIDSNMKKIYQNNKQISVVWNKTVYFSIDIAFKNKLMKTSTNPICKSKILFPTSRLCVHPFVRPFVRPCVRRLAPIPAGESQDVTNKSCSICLRRDKNAPWRSRT